MQNDVTHMPPVVTGMEALWGAANVSCPMNAGTGQCSYTPQPISLELNVWKEFTFSAEAKFGESHISVRAEWSGAQALCTLSTVLRLL